MNTQNFDKIINGLLKRYQSVAYNLGINSDDLRQEATIAIIEAKKIYDPKRGPLEALITLYVKSAIIKYLKKEIKQKDLLKNREAKIIEHDHLAFQGIDLSDWYDIIKQHVNSFKNGHMLIDYFEKDMTLREIAAKNNVSFQHIALQINAMIEKLKIRLHENIKHS